MWVVATTRGTRFTRNTPYLDYRPLAEEEPGYETVLGPPECDWIGSDLEQTAQQYAVSHVVPEHLGEVRQARQPLITKTKAAVQDRLTKEITYWDLRAEELKAQEQAGRGNARLNSTQARRRADLLQERRERRLAELGLSCQGRGSRGTPDAAPGGGAAPFRCAHTGPGPWSRPRPRGVAMVSTCSTAPPLGKPPSVRGLVWITPPGAPRRGQGPAAAIKPSHGRLAPTVQEGLKMMVHNRDRLRAIAEAGRVLERELVVFDTETTGLDGGAEISCVNGRGEVLLDTLVRPASPIPADATAVHGIGCDDVLGKPAIGHVMAQLEPVFAAAQVIASYNLSYDHRLLKQLVLQSLRRD